MAWDLIVNIIGLVAIPIALWAVGLVQYRAQQAATRAQQDREAAREALTERTKINDGAHEKLASDIEDLRQFYTRLNQGLSNFQLDVAQRYATIMALQQMEQRFVTVIERFEDKLDRHLLQDRRQ